MDKILDSLKTINTIDGATKFLAKNFSINENVKKALNFSIKSHESQFRKSGEPYVVHPILVSAITAHFSNDEHMVIAALLHDVVEVLL